MRQHLGQHQSLLLIIGLTASLAVGADELSSPLLTAMDMETGRAFKAFEQRTPSLYYLAVGVTDVNSLQVGASFGALTFNHQDRRRQADLDARCGSYARDNTHPLPGQTTDYRESRMDMPIDNDLTAIRLTLWRAIDAECRQAAERFAHVQALDITKAALRDPSDDFSKAGSEVHVQTGALFSVDRTAWIEKVKRYSRPWRQYPDIYQGAATLSAVAMTRSFVNSEGAHLQFGRVGYRLSLTVGTRSADGLDLPLHESFFAWTPDALPSDAQVMACVSNLAATVIRLRAAPLVDPYSGPAILQGEAAAVFMHEVLGHRLEGHRQKDEKQSQTFKTMVGKAVMPDFLSVLFDPTLSFYKTLPISGCYPFDEEGVRSQRILVIDHGVLKNFLMSRAPIEGFPTSNGHGRAAPGMSAVSRQSNLIVESDRPQPAAQLRALLLEACRKKNKPYGLLFAKVEGGFTQTGRYTPNAFNVRPLLVYRIYTDGRPDELVRGVDIIGTPLTALTKIMASGDDVSVFNGICGAESGGVPVAAVSPSLLLSELEVQKKELSRASGPVLPPPQESEVGCE